MNIYEEMIAEHKDFDVRLFTHGKTGDLYLAVVDDFSDPTAEKLVASIKFDKPDLKRLAKAILALDD